MHPLIFSLAFVYTDKRSNFKFEAHSHSQPLGLCIYTLIYNFCLHVYHRPICQTVFTEIFKKIIISPVFLFILNIYLIGKLKVWNCPTCKLISSSWCPWSFNFAMSGFAGRFWGVDISDFVDEVDASDSDSMLSSFGLDCFASLVEDTDTFLNIFV